MICENCGCEHNGEYGSGRFCSQKCSRGFATKNRRKEIGEKIKNSLKSRANKDVTKICEFCGIEFTVWYNKRHQKFCSRSCSSRSLSSESRKIISKKLKGKRKGKLNPMFGKSPTHTKRIEFFSHKNNKTFIFKSSYELKAAELLEKDKNVIIYKYEELIIPINEDRNYIPDFLVSYSNKGDVILEIKPENLMDKLDNDIKIEVGIKYAKDNNINFEVWNELELLI